MNSIKYRYASQAAGIFYFSQIWFTTKLSHFTTKGGYNHNKERAGASFSNILVVNKTPREMTYKIKSLFYLFAFVIASLIYYNMDSGQNQQSEKNAEVVAHSRTTNTQASIAP